MYREARGKAIGELSREGMILNGMGSKFGSIFFDIAIKVKLKRKDSTFALKGLVM